MHITQIRSIYWYLELYVILGLDLQRKLKLDLERGREIFRTRCFHSFFYLLPWDLSILQRRRFSKNWERRKNWDLLNSALEQRWRWIDSFFSPQNIDLSSAPFLFFFPPSLTCQSTLVCPVGLCRIAWKGYNKTAWQLSQSWSYTVPSSIFFFPLHCQI